MSSDNIVQNYNDYLRELMRLIRDVGPYRITDSHITNLIYNNNLYGRYGITKTDVLSDIQTIRISGNLIYLETFDVIETGTPGKAKKSVLYNRFISELAPKKDFLTRGKIADLIISNKYDTKFGICVEDVKADILVLTGEYNELTDTNKISVSHLLELLQSMTENDDILNIIENYNNSKN